MSNKIKLISFTLFVVLSVLILDRFSIGRKIDDYKGVKIFYNGLFMVDGQGKHYSKEGYYYGQKWQCVEFIKRFFYEIYGHQMPNVMGHAISYFNSNIPDGLLNEERGLIQFHNGSRVPPKEDDLIVFNNTMSRFGHVAIVSKVDNDEVEIVQQNQILNTRKILKLLNKDGCYFLGEGTDTAAGWLRLEQLEARWFPLQRGASVYKIRA